MMGLVIEKAWVDRILGSGKVWEMRSTRTSKRGPIALIAKGSGTVVGVANLVDSLGPFSTAELKTASDRHQVPDSMIDAHDYSWNHAWVLNGARRLATPVRYEHRWGSVIWVTLSDEVIAKVRDGGAAGASEDYDASCAAVKSTVLVNAAAVVGHMALASAHHHADTSGGNAPAVTPPDMAPARRTLVERAEDAGKQRHPSGSRSQLTISEAAEVLLERRLERTATPTKYIAGFRTSRGREVALERTRRENIKLWAEVGDRELVDSIEPYAASRPRNSNLNGKNAPRLGEGRSVVYLTLADSGQLERFIAWYVQQ